MGFVFENGEAITEYVVQLLNIERLLIRKVSHLSTFAREDMKPSGTMWLYQLNISVGRGLFQMFHRLVC